jgi:hypothetical protein
VSFIVTHANAAMVGAGFRKSRPSTRRSPYERIVRLLPSLSLEERRRVHGLTGEGGCEVIGERGDVTKPRMT